MLKEINEVKAYFQKKFPDLDIPTGTYAIPTNTSRGPAYMQVVVGNNKQMSSFQLFWDPDMTLSWYDYERDGSPRQNGL